MVVAGVHREGVQRLPRLLAITDEVGAPKLGVADPLPERPPRAIKKEDRPRGARGREV